MNMNVVMDLYVYHCEQLTAGPCKVEVKIIGDHRISMPCINNNTSKNKHMKE